MGDREHSHLGAAGMAVVGFALCLLAAGGATIALGAKGDLGLVSRQSEIDGGAGANSWSYGPSVSDDGRFVAFRSEATNLGLHDSGPFQTTVYVYDFKQHRIETVSRESNLGLAAHGDSRNEEISGNGRFVVFRTDATNLGGLIVANENIYVYDRQTDRVELVSRRSAKAGGGGANQNSDRPSISADGRFVSYETRSTNLSGRINDSGFENIYVYDRKEKRTFLVSRRSQGGNGGDGNSFETSIAPNAPVVVFESQARNLGGPIKTTASANVYAYNWETHRISLISRRSGGGAGVNDHADVPDVSANGRLVLFETTATNLGGPRLPAPDRINLYLHDRRTGSTVLVSRQSKGAGGKGANGSASSASLSNSGRFVTFQTEATNLGGPTGSSLNSYVYDRKQGRAILVSRAAGGGPGANEYAGEPALAGGGRFVAFSTPADNIDPPGEPAYHGNFPANTNVYRFQFAP
jgi:Tol biopolymer transport system component